ncbi:hypothetical protein B0H12DRAFT_595429 [Mycena haematopus]|nr:hypothetical protein B0H12DRAFT_595429 [Mycena haematopus]
MDVNSDIEGVTYELTEFFSFVLTMFLIEYAEELELSDARTYLKEDEDLLGKFARVLDRVKTCGHTLFVGVDNYDAPTRARTFKDLHPWECQEDFATPREIEALLDSYFWSPLMAGAHVIDKLCVTGTLFVNYPTLENLDADAVALRRACGFTENEALRFTQSRLDPIPSVTDLRLSCGNYGFSSQTAADGIVESLFHPQLVINQIHQRCLTHPPADENSFQLLSDMLGLCQRSRTFLGPSLSPT